MVQRTMSVAQLTSVLRDAERGDDDETFQNLFNQVEIRMGTASLIVSVD